MLYKIILLIYRFNAYKVRSTGKGFFSGKQAALVSKFVKLERKSLICSMFVPLSGFLFYFVHCSKTANFTIRTLNKDF